MKNITRAALILSLVVVAACSKNKADSYLDNGDANGGGYGQSGISEGGLNDPASAAYFQQTVGDRVYFTVDQSNIDDSARYALQAQADWLKTNSSYNITIEGHADEQGTREYNLALGARRANAVREYLTSLGISSSRMETVSYGKERPAEVCSAETCYALNRRAVTVINNANF